MSGYFYHFSVSQEIVPGQVSHTDGTLQACVPICTAALFKMARTEIAQRAGIKTPEKMILHSLTLLNPH